MRPYFRGGGILMANVDRGLATREAQLKEAVDILVAKHGAQSETVAVVQSRLDDVQTEIIGEPETENKDASRMSRLPQQKDAAHMLIIIGVILIFAVGGMSSMFILMLAVHW